MRQLKSTDYVQFKKTGLWTMHYTMTLCNSEAEIKAFVRSGAHREAMQKGAHVASEICSLTIRRATTQLENSKRNTAPTRSFRQA